MADEYRDRARAEWNARATRGPDGYFEQNPLETVAAFGKRDAGIILDLLEEGGARYGSVLELGPGAGRLMKHLRPKFEKAFGADISSEMIELCRKAVPDVEFFLLEENRLPVDNLDVIYCFEVFQHLPRRVCREYIAECQRALAPGGLFAFQMKRPRTIRRVLQAWFRSEPGENDTLRSRYYTWGELRSLAKGFEVVKELTLPSGMIGLWRKTS